MIKFVSLALSSVFVLFYCAFVQAQDTDQLQQGQLQPSREVKLPDTSSVSPDTAEKLTPEPTLADVTTIVPLLDFKDVEIRDILNSLAKAYKLNLWLDPSIVGNTTVYFEKVPLNDILKFIVNENNPFPGFEGFPQNLLLRFF